MFNEKIKRKESGILLYGITPPKASNTSEKIAEIADKTINRVNNLNVDGLVIYDLQDETSRNPSERPFPFSSTLDAYVYATEYLQQLQAPKVVYCSVGKLQEAELQARLEQKFDGNATVFVGVPSKEHPVNITLSRAYQIWKQTAGNVPLGAVAIPERHFSKKDEHLKMLNKMQHGCSFFITQCVYNIEYVKNLISDVYYHSKERNLEFPTLIFTLTPCGSLKTLKFLDWLGIHVPSWLANELSHCHDILGTSVDMCIKIAEEIIDFCDSKKIPFGLNIESVSIRKEEIEASQILLEAVVKILEERGIRSGKTRSEVS
ncbi:methylenetetrahydrofolate reductase [Pedobacter sp. SYSU D00535]|uniref:methylenetetrahydrofolate reductase n=1 Tax=Pedobacter sp. SYSU D00535 TaxID=2810308 RepID=UPI001A96244C|nr:methylenetetrahydrofolate reductase [Pedobacter sp. SYSU D00535]